MDLIPHDELKSNQNFNFAPMIDFLFLMLALFATLAVSRAALYDTEVELVQLKKERNAFKSNEIHQINISIQANGKYKWLTDFQEVAMENPLTIQNELTRQYQLGALPHEKEKTEILLHIDKHAPWDSVASVIFAAREAGFRSRPVYEEGK